MTTVAGLLLAACGSDGSKDESCELGTPEGCEEGEICEEVAGGEPACFAPITLVGRVFDLDTDAGIEGATVVARDGNGAAKSDVAVSDADGSYVLTLPTRRDEDGMPAERVEVTLRVAADGYQVFPLPPRQALPIDVEVTVDDAGAGSIENPATQVGLIALPSSDGVTVTGSLGADGAGALVVATQGGTAVATAVADSEGDFVLFNVPEGDAEVSAFGQGIYAAPVGVSVGSDGAEGVSLETVAETGVTVGGRVEIVDAPGGSATSVILVLEPTFDDDLVRGETPPGLRAAGIAGDFTIEGVPPGRYVVLAAFENDDLVRDPDEGIGGTEIVRIDVGESDLDIDESFKVTGALTTVSPGAEMLETVSGTPTVVWGDDSSEDGYELRVYDTFGQLIFEDTEVPRVTGSPEVSYTLDGVSFEAGQIYQFRAWSFREQGGGRRYISATEDLRGTFQVE